MESQTLGKILSVNLKRNFLPHFFAALAVAFAVPMINGISSLNEIQSASPLERLLSITGIILLTPVFYPEQNENIRDVIRSKRTDHLSVCALRVLYSVFFLAAIYGAFIMIMYFCESAVTMRHFAGGFASAVFLGAIGFFAAGVSGNVIVGYMAALIYYIANFAVKKQLGVFYLFSMAASSEGLHKDFWTKYLLMASALLLIVAAFIWLKSMYSVRHVKELSKNQNRHLY